MNYKYTFLLFGILASICFGDLNIDVYPDPGTVFQDHRFEAAMAAVRAEKAGGMTRNINVIIHEGTYQIQNTLIFEPEDGGDDNYSVNYMGASGQEMPIISGGLELPTGWTDENNDDIWEFDLQNFNNWINDPFVFRELYANNNKLTRATHPGYFKINQKLSSTQLVLDMPVDENGNPVSVPMISEFVDIYDHGEIIIYHDWNILRAIIESISYNSTTNQFIVNTSTSINGNGNSENPALLTLPNKYVQIEHLKSYLDEDEEWYVDYMEKKIYYKSSNNPNNKTFVIPKLRQIMTISGKESIPLENLNFNGIQFSYSSWLITRGAKPWIEFIDDPNNPYDKYEYGIGFPGTQGDYYTYSDYSNGIYGEGSYKHFTIPPAIEFTNTENSKILNCKLTNIANTGIAFGKSTKYNSVKNCIITELGGSGIVIGTPEIEYPHLHQLKYCSRDDWQNSNYRPMGNSISHCEISNCGNQYYGSVGIWSQFTDNTSLSFNRIHNINLTGISIGYSFQADVISMKNCLIECNEIYNVMKMLADYGGIYTNGKQIGTIIRNNYIHDINRWEYATSNVGSQVVGMFFDQGSSNISVEDNIIVDVYDDLIGYDVYTPHRSNKAGTGIVFKDFIVDNFNDFFNE